MRAGLRVAQQLSDKYYSACREIRMLTLSHSSAEKLAKLLLDWSMKNNQATEADVHVC